MRCSWSTSCSSRCKIMSTISPHVLLARSASVQTLRVTSTFIPTASTISLGVRPFMVSVRHATVHFFIMYKVLMHKCYNALELVHQRLPQGSRGHSSWRGWVITSHLNLRLALRTFSISLIEGKELKFPPHPLYTYNCRSIAAVPNFTGLRRFP